ncbi:MAG: 5'-methylthioadenosine phosphorylase [Alphaproteobacteria bacterium]|nr:5'-methylthioadenosine phosphorylase [Alphaproteobacteria bacterium]
MLGIVGGTGFYNIDGLDVVEEIDVPTPFGAPSAPLARARHGDKEIFFLPRHGKNHQFLPHEINYRANIFAFKHVGVKQMISFSAVGSLRQEIPPGDFAIPSQYFDWIKGPRVRSFFGEGLVAHISMAEPTCPNLSTWIAETAPALGIKMHTGKTYACVDGPRFGTRAESFFLRQINCDLVGMTNVPEVFLAREAQICYAPVAISTDFDCWLDDPAQHVSVAALIARYGKSLEEARKLLKALLEKPLPAPSALCRESLKDGVLSKEDALLPEKKKLLAVLRS